MTSYLEEEDVSGEKGDVEDAPGMCVVTIYWTRMSSRTPTLTFHVPREEDAMYPQEVTSFLRWYAGDNKVFPFAYDGGIHMIPRDHIRSIRVDR